MRGTDNDDVMNAIKAHAWEDAKGKLRGFAAIQGSYSSGSGHGDKYAEVDAMVETFIFDIENNGMNE